MAGILLGLRYRVWALIPAMAILVVVTGVMARWTGMSGSAGLAFVLLASIALQMAYLAVLLVRLLRK